MIQVENINNQEYEIIDISDNGIIRATGEGIKPIIERMGTLDNPFMNSLFNEGKSLHLRDSPFGNMINPLFETGERI